MIENNNEEVRTSQIQENLNICNDEVVYKDCGQTTIDVNDIDNKRTITIDGKEWSIKDFEEDYRKELDGPHADDYDDGKCNLVIEIRGKNKTIIPNIKEISKYLINKFGLVAAYDDGHPENLNVWIKTNNVYSPVGGKKEFMIKEIMDQLAPYRMDDLVNGGWISDDDILRQCVKKTILVPKKGMFPVANGILDISKMELLPDDDDKIALVRGNVPYIKGAKCPKFDKFLNDIFNWDQKKVEALLSWIGAIMAGMNPQIIVLFKSRGRSGKGVLMELLCWIFGTLATMENPDKLHARFSNVVFLFCRLVYLEEFNRKTSSLKSLKEISGGVPACGFESKGVNGIMRHPVQAAVFINSNNPPPFESGSAWEERFKMLDFPNSYVENPDPTHLWEKKVDYNIKDDLMEELPGIMNEILPYAKYALDNPGKLFKQDIPYSEIKESLDKSTDSLNGFVDECCELGSDFTVTDTTFMKRYEEYCARPDVNVSAISKQYVKNKLRKEHFVYILKHIMKGIKIT